MPNGQPFDELADRPGSLLNRLAGAGPKCGTGIILPPDRTIGGKKRKADIPGIFTAKIPGGEEVPE
jgi:hypothetical protein